MFRSAHHSTQIRSAVRARWRGAALPVLLALLAGHFVVVQLLTGAQFLDAPRNMHWGLLTWEQPGFLLGLPDTYERIKGFPPDPPHLGPMGLWRNSYGSLHPWWGPLTP
ncbi:MAG: glycosyl transferase, partial [Chloroflexaceae bacterium]|nr:glycosyl transferase [Chloroflexaceae bacterium]